MANHRRRTCKRTIRCTLCTKDRWKGNSKDRFKTKDKVKGRGSKSGKLSQWVMYLDGAVERLDD